MFVRGLCRGLCLFGLVAGCTDRDEPPDASETQALVTNPSVVGKWSDPFVLQSSLGPIVPIHMSLLRNSQVLMWSRYINSSSTTAAPVDATQTTPQAFEWDPGTGASTQFQLPNTNLFCAGHSQLSDGRLLVVGGHLGVDKGVRDANTLVPGTGWTKAASMSFDRWYPSSVALPSGEVLVAGGTTWAGGSQQPNPNIIQETPEVFQTNGTWRSLSGATGCDPTRMTCTNAITWFKYYPWNHVLSDGVVFYTGATNTTAFINPAGAGSFAPGPSRAPVLRDYGTSVQYDQDKILVIGGGTPPQKSAGKIDVSPAQRSTAAWQPTPMTYPRKQHNATILPNGSVFVSGGTTQGGDPGAVHFEETGNGPTLLGTTANKGLQIAVAAFADGRLDVYMIGLNHVIWHMWQDTALTWHSWTQVGDRRADQIAVARLPNGTAELLMAESTTQNLWHINIPAGGVTSGPFLQVGNNTHKAKHVAIAPLSTGMLDFYMVGLDNAIWHSIGATNTWVRIGTLFACGSCMQPMVVTRRPDDSSEVVILDSSNNLWHDWLDASGGDHQFQRIGDATNKGLQLAVAPFPDGRLDVYMIGLDARPWHMWQTIGSSSGSPGGTWKVNPGANFYPIGSDAVTAIAPVRLFDGHADVFVVRQVDGFLYHTNGDNAPVYPTPPRTSPTSGTLKRAFRSIVTNEPDDTSTPKQILAAPYLRTVNNVRLDSRAAIVSLDSNQNMRYNFQANGPVFSSELWDPATSTWTTTAAMQVPRTYHSTTVLLPDARVLAAGGGAGGVEPDHPNAEIYSPPYLFVPGIAQPTITLVPSSIHYGQQFEVTTTAAATNVSKVTLVGLGSTTHSFDQGQHFNSLGFGSSGPNKLTVSAPANGKITPPGWYMLFVLDRGVPSKAAMVRVGP